MNTVRKSPLAEFADQLGPRAAAIHGFDEFLAHETDWLTAPASTRFHLPYPGGLVEHSRNVARTLLRLRAELAPDLDAESCVLVGLYHDIGKAGMPGRPHYVANPSVQNRGVHYVVNRELVHMDIASRSLLLISRHVTLTDEEAQAVRYHDGQYIEENRSVAHRECRLTRLLQYADNWSAGVLEEATP